MALIVEVCCLTGPLRRGTNLLKATFRDNSLTKEFHKPNSAPEISLFHKFEWPLARNIDDDEEVLIVLMYKNVKLRQYGLLRVRLKELSETGLVSVEENLRDEKHIETETGGVINFPRLTQPPFFQQFGQQGDETGYELDFPGTLPTSRRQSKQSFGFPAESVLSIQSQTSQQLISPPGRIAKRAKPKIASFFSLSRGSAKRSSKTETRPLLRFRDEDPGAESPGSANIDGGITPIKDTLANLEEILEPLVNAEAAYQESSKSSAADTASSTPALPLRYKGLKMLDFQLCVTIIEARQLAGLNMDPCVCITVGNQTKYTSPKEQTNAPYYNEYFVFDFHCSVDQFYDQIVTVSVIQSKRLLRNSPIIGSFKMDINTVYAQPDHQFFHKWAVLTDPTEASSGPKGYVKCNISVSSKGMLAKVPPRAEKDEDDIEANLLLPVGIGTDRQRARFMLKIYRAEALPSMNTGVMANVKRVLASDSSRDLIDPYVEVSFAGHVGKTSVKKNCSCPIWNESIVFTEMFPPLVRRLRLQIRDASFSGDVVATHFIDLTTISDDGRRGFLPTFGPSWIHLYGSSTDPSILGDKGIDLNAGLGEGVAYRGRILVSFKVDFLEFNLSSPPEVSIEPCLPIAESSMGRKEQFLLFCCVMDVSMIDKKLSSKSLHLQISWGSAGSPRNVNYRNISSDSDESELDTKSIVDQSQVPCRNSTEPMKPTTRDQFYNYLPFNDRKPCLFIQDLATDQRRRLYNKNALARLSEKLRKSLEECEGLVERENVHADQQLKFSLDQFAHNCSLFLNLLRSLSSQSSGQNKLDRERLRMCQREIDRMASLARNLRSMVTKVNVSDKRRQAFAFVEQIDHLADEPQHTFPDVFVWLMCGGKGLAYERFSVEDLIYSQYDDHRGRRCGSVQSVFLRVPGKRPSELEILAHVSLYCWLGLSKSKTGFLSGLPKGYEQSKDVTEAENANALPPNSITYTERHTYDLKCHIYQARSLIGSDDTGLSDPFARVVFQGHSATTHVVEQTLSPMWNETLTLANIEIHGTAGDIQNSCPNVVVQLFDQDPAGKSEYIGQTVAQCVVKLANEPYDKPKFPPKLKWLSVYCGSEKGGEMLATFELFQLREAEDMVTSSSSSYGLLAIDRNTSIMPILPIPENIRPSLIKYRIEVLFWGLRDLKRIQLSTVEKPRIDVECAGKVLHSSIVSNYAKNPNFGTLLQHFDVDLPEDPLYWPPITIRCVDCRNFGRLILVGSHTISAIDKFMMRPSTEKEVVLESRSQNVIINIDGEPALISCDGTTASDTLVRKIATNRPRLVKKSIPQEFESLDWWSKYFASVEKIILEKKSASGSPIRGASEPTDKNSASVPDKLNKMVAIVDALKFTRVAGKAEQQKEMSRKKRSSDKISKLKVFQTELEKVPEFEEFSDCLKTFSLLRGKHSYTEGSEENRIVGKFKGSLRICKYPLSTDHQKGLFKHVPNNDPTTVLVRVYVVKANDLHPADINGKADPYIVINLGRTKINDKEQYISKQLNPLFGKCFEIEAVFPFENLLTIQIYDWDLVGMDDLIGETKIDLENRFYSRHRATCGIASKYDTEGYNIWRDPMRPTQILARLCKDYHLDGPFYMPGQVRVGSKCFLMPADPEEKTSSSKLDTEPLALFALHNWSQLPKVGCHLVPEHVETRPLYHPDKPGIEQGRLEVWVDMFSLDMPSPPLPVDISPRKPQSYELRLIIWNTDDVILEDDSFVTGEKMSDIYVKGWLKGNEDCQSTDVHYRSLTGEGNFNWRFIFPFDYLEAEEKIVISRKETMFSWDETEFKIPARLQLQVWDADSFSADDFLGALTLDLNRFPRGAKSSRSCTLSMLDPSKDGPVVNIFKQKRVKGWWPFVAKNADGELELTGKVEAEMTLVTAEEAEKAPVGFGRNEPDPLDKPNRPDTSFVWFLSPLKSIRYVLWKNYKWLILKLVLLLLFLLIVALFIYSMPGYLAKRAVGA